jgi:nitroreductase
MPGAGRDGVREAFNMQNWPFVIDLEAWKKSPERYWRNASPEIQKLVTGWMGPFYEGNEQLQRDEAMRSCGIAGQTIMLAAKAVKPAMPKGGQLALSEVVVQDRFT